MPTALLSGVPGAGLSYSTAIRLNFRFRRAQGRAGLNVSFRESDSKLPSDTSGRVTMDSGNRVAEDLEVVLGLSESLSRCPGAPGSTEPFGQTLAVLLWTCGCESSGLLELLSSVGCGAQAEIGLHLVWEAIVYGVDEENSRRLPVDRVRRLTVHRPFREPVIRDVSSKAKDKSCENCSIVGADHQFMVLRGRGTCAKAGKGFARNFTKTMCIDLTVLRSALCNSRLCLRWIYLMGNRRGNTTDFST